MTDDRRILEAVAWQHVGHDLRLQPDCSLVCVVDGSVLIGDLAAAPVDRVGGEPDMTEQTVPNATTTRDRLANLIAQFERGHHTADEMPDLILRTIARLAPVDRVGGEGLPTYLPVADVVDVIVRWATTGLFGSTVNTDAEREAMQEITSGSLRKFLLRAALVNDETADTASPVENGEDR